MQKIHIIEPFVASLGFVHNEDGRTSLLLNLPIEEYRSKKVRSLATFGAGYGFGWVAEALGGLG